MYVINCYDPHGRYVDHVGRFFLFRWRAERARRKYWSNPKHAVMVPMIDKKTGTIVPNKFVPLTTYRVEKRHADQ